MVVVPGAANALTARIIEELGFEAVYVTGAGVANSYLGAPDLGLVTLNELAGHVAAIRDAVELPLIVDMDTGFGNPIGVGRAVRELVRAGADALQIEDQLAPKRCGHFDGTAVISIGEMEQKIRAAVDSRADDNVSIIARTDARASLGMDAAVERAMRYVAAGADATFIEAPQSVDELRRIPKLVPAPQVVNLVEGGRTPLLPVAELADFRIVLYANVALQAAMYGMQQALGVLLRTGSLQDTLDQLVRWDERQRLVRKPHFDELEQRYVDQDADRPPSSGPAGTLHRSERGG